MYTHSLDKLQLFSSRVVLLRCLRVTCLRSPAHAQSTRPTFGEAAADIWPGFASIARAPPCATKSADISILAAAPGRLHAGSAPASSTHTRQSGGGRRERMPHTGAVGCPRESSLSGYAVPQIRKGTHPRNGRVLRLRCEERRAVLLPPGPGSRVRYSPVLMHHRRTGTQAHAHARPRSARPQAARHRRGS